MLMILMDGAELIMNVLRCCDQKALIKTKASINLYLANLITPRLDTCFCIKQMEAR